jgi:hypothetical protein
MKIMRLLLAVSLLIASGFSPAMGAEQVQDVLRCTGTMLGAPSYAVAQVDPDDGPIYYRLVKQPNNPFYGPYSADLSYGDVIRYGDTFILTIDEGRSGYAMIYDRNDTTFLDVDLFQRPELGTGGVTTSYTCEPQTP